MKYLLTKHRFIRHLSVYPVIYPAVIFVILLDVWIEIYHRVAFPCYGVAFIRRRDYIKIYRHRLRYLNPMQKFNCVYCGYANGVIQYMARIIAETESYWCGIQHRNRDGFIEPAHHIDFLKFGDKERFKEDFDSRKTKML